MHHYVQTRSFTDSVTDAGGSATQSELIYERIRTLAKQTKTPVYTFAEDIAASGACVSSPSSQLFPIQHLYMHA